jgi:hypothetical protein
MQDTSHRAHAKAAMVRSRPPHQPESLDADQIAQLASELDCDRALVEDVYRSEVDRLARSAQVPDYVSLFAARRTRDRLKRLRGRSR